MEKYTENGLSYLHKGDRDIKSCPKAYFCAGKDDSERYLTEIADEIFKINSQVVIFYFNHQEVELSDEEDIEMFMHDLRSMQLFIIPITSGFLSGTDRAYTEEFKLAVKHNIPILPLMQEPDLVDRFNDMCGEIQYLDKYEASLDMSAIPYEKRLEIFLSETMFDEEFIERVKAAFATSIFLSYRKKDRMQANELMRMIHSIPRYRDLAIWFDEFLTPGEKWYDSIKTAMSAAELVTLLVTPSLLEPGNFIASTEYPEAVAIGKEVVPLRAGGKEIDGKQLKELYLGIVDPVDMEDIKAVEECLKRIALRECDDDPAHIFLIGSAYLWGINVEVDTAKGLSLIKEAASKGLPEAHEKLEEIYEYGKGVKIDYKEAYKWQESYIDLIKDSAPFSVLYDEYEKLETLQTNCAEYQKAYETVVKLIELVKDTEEGLPEDKRMVLGKLYVSAGNCCVRCLNRSSAMECFGEAVSNANAVYKETGNEDALRGICITTLNMGQIYLDEQDFDKAAEQYRKTINITGEAVQKLKDSGYIGGLYGVLSTAMKALGDIYSQTQKEKEAKKLYEEAIKISTVLFDNKGLLNDAMQLVGIYNSLGILYRRLRKHKDAIKTLNEALKLLELINESFDSAEIMAQKAQIYNSIANAYAEKKDIKQAVVYYEKAIELKEAVAEASQGLGAQNMLASSYNNLGVMCYRLKDYDKANENFEKAEAVKKFIYDKTGDFEMLKELAMLYNTVVVNVLEPDRNKKLLKIWYPKMAELYELIHEKTGDESAIRVLWAIYSDYLKLLIDDGEKEKAEEVAAKIRKIVSRASD